MPAYNIKKCGSLVHPKTYVRFQFFLKIMDFIRAGKTSNLDKQLQEYSTAHNYELLKAVLKYSSYGLCQEVTDEESCFHPHHKLVLCKLTLQLLLYSLSFPLW